MHSLIPFFMLSFPNAKFSRMAIGPGSFTFKINYQSINNTKRTKQLPILLTKNECSITSLQTDSQVFQNIKKQTLEATPVPTAHELPILLEGICSAWR